MSCANINFIPSECTCTPGEYTNLYLKCTSSFVLGIELGFRVDVRLCKPYNPDIGIDLDVAGHLNSIVDLSYGRVYSESIPGVKELLGGDETLGLADVDVQGDFTLDGSLADTQMKIGLTVCAQEFFGIMKQCSDPWYPIDIRGDFANICPSPPPPPPPPLDNSENYGDNSESYSNGNSGWDDGSGLGAGELVGIAAGGIAGLSILLVLVLRFFKNKQPTKELARVELAGDGGGGAIKGEDRA